MNFPYAVSNFEISSQLFDGKQRGKTAPGRSLGVMVPLGPL